MIKWAVDLHNEVNRQTGKDIFDFNKIYQKYKGRDTNFKTKITIILTVILIILLILYVKFS